MGETIITGPKGTSTSGVDSVNGKKGVVLLTGADIKTDFINPFGDSDYNGNFTISEMFNGRFAYAVLGYLFNDYYLQLQGTFDGRYAFASDLDYTNYYKKSETYSRQEILGLVNPKLDATVADNTYFKKSGGIINGTPGLEVRGSKTPLLVAAVPEGIYRTLFVGVEKNSAGIEETMFEIYTDDVASYIKTRNPITGDIVIIRMHPTDPLQVQQGTGVFRDIAYKDELATGAGIKTMIVSNISTTTIPTVGSIVSNKIVLVSTLNEITGASLNDNVVTLPTGKYEIKATVHLNKTGSNGASVDLGLSDGTNIIRNSVRTASWGSNATGTKSYDWVGVLNVVGTKSFSIGIIAEGAGFTFLTDTNRDALVFTIAKIG